MAPRTAPSSFSSAGMLAVALFVAMATLPAAHAQSSAGGTGLTFSSTSGKFSGTWNSVAFPSASVTAPGPAALLGTVGYSTDFKLIYGPFEAGFGSTPTATVTVNTQPPYPCYDASTKTYSGYCPGGMDVGACEAALFKSCPAGTVQTQLFMDKCGGHANPYHYHTDMLCHYDATAAGHSTIVGVMLDGRGLYGRFEATTTMPTDLDACGGHEGMVPANSTWGIGEGAKVYHYHAQTKAPFLLGCYGPVKSVAECRALYPTADVTTSSSGGGSAAGGGTGTAPLGATEPATCTTGQNACTSGVPSGNPPTCSDGARPACKPSDAAGSTTPAAPATAPSGSTTPMPAKDGASDPSATCTSSQSPCTSGTPSGNPPKCSDGARPNCKPADGTTYAGKRHLLQSKATQGGCDGSKSVQLAKDYYETFDLWCPCYPHAAATATSPTTTTSSPTPATPPSAKPAAPGTAVAEAAKLAAEAKKVEQLKDAKEKSDVAKKAMEEKKAFAETAKKAADVAKVAAQDKRKVADTAKATAMAARDKVTSKLNGTNARKAQVMVDAAAAGRNVTKIRAALNATNATDACDQMCSKMKVNASLVVCEATAKTARRHLLATSGFDVNVLANPDVVNTTSATLIGCSLG